ncbi:MAG: lamin tail domain-containing protein, partial [Thermoplasmata archaeon]
EINTTIPDCEDACIVYIDADKYPGSGYMLGPIGAEYKLEILGSAGKVKSAKFYGFQGIARGEQGLWHELNATILAVPDAYRMEILVLTNLPKEVNVLFYMTNWKKEFDFSDTLLNENGAFMGTRSPGPVINEVCPGSNGWVEIYNPDGLDLTGYYIAYARNYYDLPGGTATFQVVSIPNLQAGKTITLYNPDDQGIDSITPPSQQGVSYIRYPDGGEWYGWTDTATPGDQNEIPEFSPNLIFAVLLMIPIVWRRKWPKKSVRFVERS